VHVWCMTQKRKGAEWCATSFAAVLPPSPWPAQGGPPAGQVWQMPPHSSRCAAGHMVGTVSACLVGPLTLRRWLKVDVAASHALLLLMLPLFPGVVSRVGLLLFAVGLACVELVHGGCGMVLVPGG
jgi:hypothetical protein